MTIGLALGAGCLAPSGNGGLPPDARSALVVEPQSQIPRVAAFAADEVHFSGSDSWVLAYAQTLEQLGLAPGELASAPSGSCDARTLGAPLSVFRIADEVLAPAVVADVPIGAFRLPPLDVVKCMSRGACPEVADGFAVCRPECAEPAPMPPNPPQAPMLPSYCADAGCPMELDDCPPGEVRLPLSGCQSLARCGPDRFRVVDTASIGASPRYVDALAPDGGDGSLARPLQRLDAALSPGVTAVLLAPGRYTYGALQPLGRIYGLCPSLTHLELPTGANVDSSTYLEGLSLEAVSPVARPWLIVTSVLRASQVIVDVRAATTETGLAVEPGGSAFFEHAEIYAGHSLLRMETGARLEARHSLVDGRGLADASIAVAGGALVLEDSRFKDGNSPQRAGSITSEGGSVTLRSVRFTPGGSVGIKVRDGATLDAEDVVFDTLAGSTCDGLIHAAQSEVRLTRTVMRNACRGLNTYAGTLSIDDLTATDTGLDGQGRRIFLLESNLTDIRVARWRLSGQGPAFNLASGQATIEDLDIVVDGQPTLTVMASAVPAFTLRRARIVVPPGGLPAATGLVIFNSDGSATLEDLDLVANARALDVDQNGANTDVTGARLRLRANQIGLLCSAQTMRVEDLSIESTEVGVVGALSERVRRIELSRFAIAANLPWSVTRAEAGVAELRNGRFRGTLPAESEPICWPTWGWRWSEVQWTPE